MRVVTADEMRNLDNQTITDLGIESLVLMENAGVAVVQALAKYFGDLAGKRVHIIVGPGNNGGDGLVVARHLLNKKARPKVYLATSSAKLSPDARRNLDILHRLESDIIEITTQSLTKLKFSLSFADIIVDALLGTGAKGPLRGQIAEIARLVNEVNRPVVSIDIPTGIDPSTGQIGKVAIKADLTVTLGFAKLGSLLYPGKAHTGDCQVVDIGIPEKFAEDIQRFSLDKDDLSRIPPRPSWGHKGTFGHTLVIAGSQGMAGAANLTAQAVLRSGGGMVTLAVPDVIADRFTPNEIIVRPIPSTPEGTFGIQSIDTLRGLLTGKDVVAIGPGLSQSPEVRGVLEYVLTNWDKPVVIDADGLNLLTKEFMRQISKEQIKQWVLTPHPGEMGRLVGKSARDINKLRSSVPVEFAEKWGCTVVLKGAPTVVCGQHQMYICTHGNHGMGSAGMGDVLTGVIAALLSQGTTVTLGAALGTLVHGMAGDAGAANGATGLIASDLLASLKSILV